MAFATFRMCFYERKKLAFFPLNSKISTSLQGSADSAGGDVQLQRSLRLTSAAVGHRRLPEEMLAIDIGKIWLPSTPPFGAMPFWIAEKVM